MKVSWLNREHGHWKLVVEPLNVLLTLKLHPDGYSVDCLGFDFIIKTRDLLSAKVTALVWFDGIIENVLKKGRELHGALEKELGQQNQATSLDP